MSCSRLYPNKQWILAVYGTRMYTEMISHQHGMDGVSKTDHPILGDFGHPKFGTSFNLTKPWISWTYIIFGESGRETPRTCGSLPFFWKGNALSGRLSFGTVFPPAFYQWPVEQTWCWCSKAGPTMGTWGCEPPKNSTWMTWEDEFAALQITDDGRFSSLAWDMWRLTSASLELPDFIASTDDIGLCRKFSVNVLWIFCDVEFCKATPSLTWTMRCKGVLWLSVVIWCYLWHSVVQFTSLHHLGHLADGDFWLKDDTQKGNFKRED